MKSQLLILHAAIVGFLIIVLPSSSEACGPGRGGLKGKKLRKYQPLVQRQYIPNVSENTLGASGRPEGAIKRKDKRFKELVQNWNPDIEFRDDERTGADRMMSQRLKEKLSTLAISVMNHWPNVKLRVIEGWDEDNKHSQNSLHYEGRAVDITTSDRDNSKYGMLARLAVEAGFDWVHYESRSHVHCSVKSEKADTIRSNGCFDANSLLETPDGQTEMSQLQTNDMVLTMNPKTGQFQYSPIIMWLDKDELGQELFVELRTKSNKLIRLTSSHLIYVADEPFDLTQLSSEPTSVSKLNRLSPNTGSGDNNNKNFNYYYYETPSLIPDSPPANEVHIGDGYQALSNVPNTNSKSQLPNNYSPAPSTPGSIDELVIATYARNTIVGQYLLVNTQQEFHQDDDTHDIDAQNERPLIESITGSGVADRERNVERSNSKHLYDFDDHPKRPSSRLVFENSKVSEENVQRNSGSTSREQSKAVLDQIVSVNYVTRKGIYAPLTREGNIVVNSVVASCYAVISDHDLAHLSFAPVRWLSYINEWFFGLEPKSGPRHRTLKTIDRQSDIAWTVGAQAHITGLALNDRRLNGQTVISSSRVIHWYPSMLYRIAKFILPTRYLY